MAPEPQDRKRKRGRPPGALKVREDASSREQPEANRHDAEGESRPKKRGRKTVTDTTAPNPRSQMRHATAEPAKRGRPTKAMAQATGAEVEAGAKPFRGKTKAPHGRVDVDPPSSENRRSGRERRTNTSPTQFTSPPSDSSRMPPPPRRTKKAEPEPPNSTPRRGGRDRRQWDAERYFNGSGQKDAIPVMANRQSKKGALAPQEPGAAKKPRKQKPASADLPEEEAPARKTRQQRPVAQDSVAEKKLPPPGSQQKSPGGGPSRARNQQGEEAPESVVAPASSSAHPKRRGRKAVVDTSTKELKASEPSASRGPRGRRPNTKAAEEQAQEPVLAKSKRKEPKPQRPEPEVEQEADLDSSEDDEELPYRYMAEIIRNVSHSTIKDKWIPLDPPACHIVSAFFADVQRSVLLRLQTTTQQRGHASAALAAITRRLRSRLGRGYPFPPPTTTTSTRTNAASYEDDFDFERMVDAKQALEHTLNPLLHSVGLLEREIDKEEAALARDYDQLHNLEANAKSAAAEWRDKSKREHMLAPGIRKKADREVDARNRLELVPAIRDGISGGLFKDLEDEDLVTLSQQIGSHMKSMKDNLLQIEGVVPAIVQSKAALQHVLLRHLDDEQYENVLLGGSNASAWVG